MKFAKMVRRLVHAPSKAPVLLRIRGSWTRLAAIGALFVLLASNVDAQSPTAPDTSWKTHVGFLPDGSGIWIASNAAYRTAENREPAAYGQRYWLGVGRTAVHGCLWGEYGTERPVFWRFFTAWDPSRRQMLLHQEAPSGVIGIGYESIGTGIADQTFTTPAGETSILRHVSRRVSRDSMITQSFDKVGDDWRPRRSYTWVRQPPGTPAGC